MYDNKKEFSNKYLLNKRYILKKELETLRDKEKYLIYLMDTYTNQLVDIRNELKDRNINPGNDDERWVRSAYREKK